MCGTTNEICHTDFEFVLPCGCCPCKYQVEFPLAGPISLGGLMELAKSNGMRVIVWQNTTPGEEPIDFKVEELPKIQKNPKPAKSLPKGNPRPSMKITKRVTTQSERTAARKLKKRQHEDEIASKQAKNISGSIQSSSKTQVKNDDAQATVAETETLEAVAKFAQQKKKPKTHFRKTKKPGRA